MNKKTIQEVARRISRDPRVILDRMYYAVRGIRVIELKNKHDNCAGTLSALAHIVALEHEDIKKIPLTDVVGKIVGDVDTKELGDLFAHYGSDKSTMHDYHRLYASLLNKRRDDAMCILEIGLGTNNTDVPSSMGKEGKPGASLRAFRDWAPNALIYGADVDTGCLFSEERIATYFVDQTKPETFEALASEFSPHSFDLIIDDGLHTPWANMNTLIFALQLLKPNGVFVVEDIVEKYVPIWKAVAFLLSRSYKCRLVQTKAASVFLVTRAY